jgi:superfamily II DNA/RNA helicase
VQAEALPVLLERGSVAAISETGSSKPLTYVLPVLDRREQRRVLWN